MANWTNLKAAVSAVIKTNGNQEITGQILQNTLNDVIANLGAGATYVGVATPTTNPGTPDGNNFYFAQQRGTYPNFNGIVIDGKQLYVLTNTSGTWVAQPTGIDVGAANNVRALILMTMGINQYSDQATEIPQFEVGIMNQSGIVQSEHTTYATSDFISARGVTGDKIYIGGEFPGVNGIGFCTLAYFDANKNFICGTSWNGKKVVMCDNVFYVRVSWRSDLTKMYTGGVIEAADINAYNTLLKSNNLSFAEWNNGVYTALSVYSEFKLTLYKGVENTQYYIFGLYNGSIVSGVPVFKVAKDVNGVRTSVTPNSLLLANMQSNGLYRVYLMDGNGYIEFRIDVAKYGGIQSTGYINYFAEQLNKKILITPTKIVERHKGWQRIDFEQKNCYYINNSGTWVTGDQDSQKSGFCPIPGNVRKLKITSKFSGEISALVVLDKDMNVITTVPQPTDRVMKDYVIDFVETTTQTIFWEWSQAAYIGVNGTRGNELSVYVSVEEPTLPETIDEVIIPYDNFINNQYYDYNGVLHQGGVSNQMTLELPVKFGDRLIVHEYMNASAAPLAVYFNESGAFIGYDGTAFNPKSAYMNWLNIPPTATKVIINCSVSNGTCLLFAGNDTAKNLRRVLQNYNPIRLVRTVASWYGTDGQLKTGDYAGQSATRILVTAGQKMKITTSTSGYVPLLVCVDINGSVIEYKENSTENVIRDFTDYQYTIPEKGFYLMVNGRTNIDLTVKSLNITTIGRYEVEKRFEKIENNDEIPDNVWLKGKRVLWLGTSIPAGGQYPQRSCSAVGATCINKAIGASFIRFGEHNPTTPITTDTHRLTGLSQTKAEKTEVWADWCTPEQLAYALTTSWEEMIVPYMSGANKVDLIVIDHGFNDRNELGTADDILAYNRDTFLGAMAYVIKQIRTIDFRMRIAIATHYDSTMQVFNAANIVAAQELIGKTFGVHVMQSYLLTGLSNEWIPGTSGLYPTYPRYEADPNTGDLTLIQCWMPDGVHMHSDTTGQAQTMFSEVYTQFLKNIR